MNMIITHQDRIDSQDAKSLGIGLSEYKDAKAIIYASHRTISRDEILSIVRGMKINSRVGRN